MTAFVGVEGVSKWVAEKGAEKVIGELTDYLADDYVRWEEFDKKPRVASHSEVGVIELMPAADSKLYGFKYVNGHPANPARGFQTVTAFGALAEVHNGYPILIAEMTLLTALRTAATSALAARTLARKDSKKLGMIGSGCQSPFQALAMRSALGINDLSVWDVDAKAMETFAAHAKSLGFNVRIATSAADAVDGVDVVTTCTADKALATVLHDCDIAKGMHLNAIGGDCPGKTELETSILHRPESQVFVEFEPQTRIEGEIQHCSPDFPVTELWTVLAGQAEGRRDSEAITIFDSVGFGIEDFTVLRYIHEKMADSAYMEEIDIIADPENPKDLYSLIAAQG
ncbi:ornithine cyclodeaminase [Actinomycetaceae bacterium TAE3-ERU4]|nr:ornithine cyclodeaminase [Actinomycetaceae bacterium TAE3-ERU4]